MGKFFSFLIGIIFMLGLSNEIFAQWAENKNAREDAIYVRFLQGSEDVVLDGVEDAIWAKADSVIVGYGQTTYLPGSGYDLWTGKSIPGDSANAVAKFLYKKPYIYLLFKVEDKSVGGWDWSQFDAIILAFKEYTAKHSWVQAWDKRVEHFYTWGSHWAYADSFSTPPVGASPLFMGNNGVAGGMEEWRTPSQKERWEAVTNVIGGFANDTLADLGWISEHRIRVDSLGFNPDGDVLPFSFSMFDADGFLDSTSSNDAHTRTWWGCPWNENWFYSALFLDPDVTTSSAPGMIPPVDYTIPKLREGQSIVIDGDNSEWQADNTLHFKAKYDDDALFDQIKGTGAWASGYQQLEYNGNLSIIVDGPEVDYDVTYDDENLYVSAKVSDQIVAIPDAQGTSDDITFIMAPRTYVNGNGIFPAKVLTVRVDSSGNGQAKDDLTDLADTAGVEFSLHLNSGTDINDNTQPDSGYTVELKIPFSSFGYPPSLGDSVVFIGGIVDDYDVFDDINSNYYAKTWWFVQQPGQHAPAWVALGPANSLVSVDDKIQIPLSIELLGNYPNPFNPSTKIKYSINVMSDVTLSVFNILGQRVSVINNLNVQPGYNEFNFDASGLASGVYLYQLKIHNLGSSQEINTKVSKMVLLK
ncbi:MAG: T9SS type A sorting domain-containing protein [Ignavibacteriaceae bacterium]